ncbi:type VI secretion system ATPase TssH, partial [candidate division GN15 bacterium]|nr:type VI secretion system ATPase TssH [candidate division GN15 bacterium]
EVVYENIRKNVLERLRQTLRPEFLNRIDETIVFSSLIMDEIKQIVRLQLTRLEKLLDQKEISLTVSDEAVGFIGETAFDQTFGARPIKRYVNKELSQKVAKMLLAGELKPGQQLDVTREGDHLKLSPSGTRPEQQAVEA